MTDEPVETPMTLPSVPTVALVVSELNQEIVRSIACPALPAAVATSLTDAPGTTVAVSRASVTVVTAGVGVGVGPVVLSPLHARVAASETAIAILLRWAEGISKGISYYRDHCAKSVKITMPPGTGQGAGRGRGSSL